ncbi:Uncharacterised protein [Shigella sonnei]|nr:Uncharacterised protein [Shigella sonnei]
MIFSGLDKLFSKSIFCHFTSESVIKQIGFGLLPFELQSFPSELVLKAINCLKNLAVFRRAIPSLCFLNFMTLHAFSIFHYSVNPLRNMFRLDAINDSIALIEIM